MPYFFICVPVSQVMTIHTCSEVKNNNNNTQTGPILMKKSNLYF